jgi:branched-chain amino acid transport system ATP-binding protein
VNILEVRGLTRVFGGLSAVREVDLDVREGEIAGLIGPNGAGKTTLFALVAGALRPTRGRIVFAGRDVTEWPAFRRCRAGLVRTHQIPRPFRDLTVADNVRVGVIFGSEGRWDAPVERAVERVLETVGLAARADVPVSQLAFADVKRLEVARALACRPRLLLLDEVMAGLNPAEVDAAMDLVRRIRASGVTVFIIEHHMRAIMGVCDRVIVLDHGERLAVGTPAQVAADPAVVEAYLGSSLEAGPA